ncbi:hypothetical protein H4R23_002945 [Coemansia sp. Cherry 401B]|nr:hypothetical protein H4R23_002945 [Coemansia sp. Cherry 401B]
MKLFAAISAVAAIATAAETTLPVTNDVGLIYTNLLCGTNPCSQSNLSGLSTYTAYLGNRDFRRILMSFSLGEIDPSSITSCQLQLPQPVPAPNNVASTYTLGVSPVTGEYDAKTVTPVTAPPTGSAIARAANSDQEIPGPIDVTSACQNALNGNVGLALDSSGSPVTFSAGTATLIVSTN